MDKIELLQHTRSLALLLLSSCLTHRERWALLGGILGYKSKVRHELNNFLKYRGIIMQAQNIGVKTLKGKKTTTSNSSSGNSDSNNVEDSVALGLLRRTKHNLLQILPVPNHSSNHSTNAMSELQRKSTQMLEKLHETKYV